MKRTTLVLEDGCFEGIRDLARSENRQISQVVNEILAEGLSRRKNEKRPAFEIPTFDMGEPRVNVADRDQLESVMEC